MKKYEKEVIKAQMSEEQKQLEKLKVIYNKALQDTQERIAELNSDPNLQDLQSVIYQKRYQEVIAKQLESTIKDLNTNVYKSINDFAEKSYKNGYIGSMYSLQNQGIPLTIPIDDRKVVKAVTVDSKLSTKYYKANPLKGRVAEDITLLKKRIQNNLSRGIASGQSWVDVAYNIAGGMNNNFGKALSDAMRIVRTEGHRIHQQGYLDACYEAKNAGADVVKQWDATLDSFTRPAHAEADGQIRELDEPFVVDGEELDAPGVGGSASNVINCRCQLLQRARWTLDEAELEAIYKRAEYFGLDKNDTLDEYYDKFIGLSDNVKLIDNVDNLKRKFEKLTDGYYSYDDFVKDFKTVEDGFEGASAEDIAKAKEIFKRIQELEAQTNSAVVTNLHENTKHLINSLSKEGIKYNEVGVRDKILSESEIIKLISGGDKTKGSCSSLSLCYLGQKKGLDVLDFRGGKSLEFFSDKLNKKTFFEQFPECFKSVKGKNTISVGLDLIKQVEEGKEYLLGAGKHNAVVRKQNGILQYLELQSETKSGWHDFADKPKQTLIKRFGCTRTGFRGMSVYEGTLIDVEKFDGVDDLQELLGYINTAESSQLKGVGGYEK